MTQAGAKGPAYPAKAPIPAAKGATSPATPAVAPKPAQPTPPNSNTAVTPKATAPVAAAAHTPAVAPQPPKAPKGPPPLPPESGPDVHAKAAEPMRPRFETAPGMGYATAADTPRTPGVQSREEIQAMIRASVDGAVAAVLGETQRLVRALEHRIDDLERRPVAAPVAPAPPMVAAMAHQPVRVQAAAQMSAIPVSLGPAPVLDVRAIELDTSIQVDAALDGSRRKRNLVIVIVLLILAVFGGLFAMLAQSYAHHT